MGAPHPIANAWIVLRIVGSRPGTPRKSWPRRGLSCHNFARDRPNRLLALARGLRLRAGRLRA